MTTDAERECYYRLAKEASGNGAIVEFGAWLGASTAYIAAGIRDSGKPGKAHVYDKFQSKPGHVRKVREFYDKQGLDQAPIGDAFMAFRKNLGPLLDYVKPHRCEIAAEQWNGEPIALVVTDAPKRIPQISAVLTNFRSGLQAGTVMAWQDFCHFPSYEIPACLWRLREHLDFVEAVVPGTTLVFRLNSLWPAGAVSRAALALDSWDEGEIGDAWEYWLDGFVPPEKASLFLCGEAMFLHDRGFIDSAVTSLKAVLATDADAVLPKWRYLRDARPDFVARYSALFECVASHEINAAVRDAVENGELAA